MSEVQDAIEQLASARRILAEHHDTVDGEHQTDVRPNWAMKATNAIDEALSYCPPHAVSGASK